MTLSLHLDLTGETRLLPAGTFRIGRGPDNDWVLADDRDRTVSRRHCLVSVTSGGATLVDLGSSNGTSVNGRPLEPHLPVPIGPGDSLSVGSLRLRVGDGREAAGRAGFDPVDAPVTAPLAEDPFGFPFPQAAPPRREPAQPAILPLTPPSAGFDDDHLARFLEDIRVRDDPPPGPPPAPGPTAHHPGPVQNRSLGVRPQPQGIPADPPDPPPRPLPRGAGDGEAMAAFLEGAGLSAETFRGADPAATLREAGRTFAVMAEGLRTLLAARAAVKRDAELSRTVVQASHNNPLKFCANGVEAAAALLCPRGAGYMPPADAAREAVGDLMAHELGMLDGLEAAVDDLLSGLDPARLEERLAETDTLTLLIRGGRRAQLWDLYRERYAGLAGAARKRFLGEAAHAFREAYERGGEFRGRPARQRRRGG